MSFDDTGSFPLLCTADMYIEVKTHILEVFPKDTTRFELVNGVLHYS